MCKSKELQDRIERLQNEMVDIVENRSFKMDSGVQVAKRQSEIFVAASQLGEISTRRIVHLTWALVALTFGLLIFTVFLYKDTHQMIQREKQTNNNTIQKP